MVSKRREEEFARQYKQTGNKEFRDKAVNEMRDLVYSHINSMNLSKGIDNRTLYYKGLGLATQAVETWDPHKSKLSTHVVNSLKPLLRDVYKYGPTLHVPEHIIKDIGELKAHYSNYVNMYGDRDVDPLVLCDMSGMSLKRVRDFLKRERATLNTSTEISANQQYVRSDHRMDMEYLNEQFKDPPLKKQVWSKIAKALNDPNSAPPNARDIHRTLRGRSYYEVNKVYKEIVETLNEYLKTIT